MTFLFLNLSIQIFSLFNLSLSQSISPYHNQSLVMCQFHFMTLPRAKRMTSFRNKETSDLQIS
jgi:hypothetical protein